MQAKEEGLMTDEEIAKFIGNWAECPIYIPNPLPKMEDLTKEQREDLERTRLSIRKTLSEIRLYRLTKSLETITHQQDSGNQ